MTAVLPLLDEHATSVAADVDRVWAALLETVDRSFTGLGAARYARAVGCAETTPSGPRPLAVGSTVPGFRVVTAEAPRELVLAGRHRFSAYTVTFRVDDVGSGCARLRAESRASFPGVAGRAYRLLVVGTRGHVLVVRRVLTAVRRRAERGTE